MKWAEEKLETIRQRERAESLEKKLEHERYMRKEAESMAKEYEAMLKKIIRDNRSYISSVEIRMYKLKILPKCRELGIHVENKTVYELRSEIAKILHPGYVVCELGIVSMDMKTVQEHCQECGIDIESKSHMELQRELLKITRDEPAPSPVAAVVQETAPSPVAAVVQETAPSPVEAVVQEAAPSPVEACPAPVGSVIDVDEEPADVTKARIVMNAYNKLLENVLISPVRDAKLLCAHAENLGVEVKHQKREQLVEEMRVALAAGAQLSNPVKMLQMYEKRLVELADFAIQKHKQPTINVNASTLRAHCKHYALADDFTLSCLNKDQLYDLLLGKLRT
jgi:hypothetical protein